jgi:hypothetical protein
MAPVSAFVRPERAAMFHTRCPSAGDLAGLLVGSRRESRDAWTPAIAAVTVEAVIVHGVSLPIGPWQDLIADGDIGWPLFGRVRVGQTLVVYIRNDAREIRELRAVLVLAGAGGRRGTGRLRLRG